MASLVHDLLATCTSSAVHLEMRDAYMQDDPEFLAWKDGHKLDPVNRESWWRPWLDTVAAAVGRGVAIRRARIVSEPVTDYIAWEHEITFTNVAAGEKVRWLPRRQAATLLVPGADLWIFDGATVVFNHFTGDGQWALREGEELVDDPDVVAQCTAAFEIVWARGLDHEDYTPAR
jgi:hypothetical protein